MEEKPGILILMPTEMRMEARSALAFTNLCLALVDQGYDVDFKTITGTAHAAARNALFQSAYSVLNGSPRFKYVLWLDSDHVFEPIEVFKLIASMEEHNLKAVSACYFTRSDEPRLIAMLQQEDGLYEFVQKFEPDMLYKVDAVGFGMFLIRPEIMTRIYDRYGKNVFEFPLRNGVVVGEDVRFCELMREQGYEIFINTAVIIGHTWTTVMDLEMAKYVKERTMRRLNGN